MRKLTQEKADAINRKRDLVVGTEPSGWDIELPPKPRAVPTKKGAPKDD